MKTKKINQPETSSNRVNTNNKKNTAAMGTATIAGMAVGAVGMNIVDGDSIEEDATAQDSLTAQAQETTVKPESVETEPETVHEEPQAMMETQPTTESQPITEAGTFGRTEEHTQQNTDSEELTQDDLVDNIIAGEEIDPADVDVTNIINVDRIGTVYTVDGQNMLAAAIHDNEGNELMMVDVDGDGVFDVIATPEGEAITEVGGDIDVSDAEHMITSEDSGWLAANDFDNSMDVGSDIQNDIIEA